MTGTSTWRKRCREPRSLRSGIGHAGEKAPRAAPRTRRWVSLPTDSPPGEGRTLTGREVGGDGCSDPEQATPVIASMHRASAWVRPPPSPCSRGRPPRGGDESGWYHEPHTARPLSMTGRRCLSFPGPPARVRPVRRGDAPSPKDAGGLADHEPIHPSPAPTRPLPPLPAPEALVAPLRPAETGARRRVGAGSAGYPPGRPQGDNATPAASRAEIPQQPRKGCHFDRRSR